MTAYGLCATCGVSTGSDVFNGAPIPMTNPPEYVMPGMYYENRKQWLCHKCAGRDARPIEAVVHLPGAVPRGTPRARFLDEMAKLGLGRRKR